MINAATTGEVFDAPSLTLKQRELARHALGLPNAIKQSYRNRYFCSLGNTAYNDWMVLVTAGLALHDTDERHNSLDLFYLTPEGAELALKPGEKLCPEDFPKQID